MRFVGFPIVVELLKCSSFHGPFTGISNGCRNSPTSSCTRHQANTTSCSLLAPAKPSKRNALQLVVTGPRDRFAFHLPPASALPTDLCVSCPFPHAHFLRIIIKSDDNYCQISRRRSQFSRFHDPRKSGPLPTKFSADPASPKERPPPIRNSPLYHSQAAGWQG